MHFRTHLVGGPRARGGVVDDALVGRHAHRAGSRLEDGVVVAAVVRLKK